MRDSLPFLLAALLVALLVSCGLEDARQRTIANWKNAAIALLAPLWWWANHVSLWPGVAAQIGVALILFTLFIGAFALGQMGGGDVKLIGAVALWFPFVPMMRLLMAMAVVGGIITLAIIIDRYFRKSTGAPEIPYGVAIVVAGLLVIREPLFNQFT